MMEKLFDHAKEKGYKLYDFLGIAPKDAPKSHSWSGITHFKKKFGGKEITYHPAQERPFKKIMYWNGRSVTMKNTTVR